MKPNVSSNTEVILFDKNFTQLLSGNRFLGLDKIKLEKKELGHIYQIQVFNSYGQEEIYRMILMETNISSVSTNIKYAAVLINTSQLEQASQKAWAIDCDCDGKFLDFVFACQSLSS